MSTDTMQMISVPYNYEELNIDALNIAQAALNDLQSTIVKVLSDFDNCGVFTFYFRQQIMAGISTLKTHAQALHCEALIDYINLLEGLTIAAYRSETTSDRECLKALIRFVGQIEIKPSANPQEAQQSLLDLTDTVWSYIEQIAS